MENPWENLETPDPLEDIRKAQEVNNKPQRPTFVLPKWILQQYGISVEDVKKIFGENIILI